MRKTVTLLSIVLLATQYILINPAQTFAYYFSCGDSVTYDQCNAMGGCDSGERCTSVGFAYQCQTDSTCDGVPTPPGCNNANYGITGPPACAAGSTCSYIPGPGVGGGFICTPPTGGGSGTQGWQPEECDAYTAGGDPAYKGVRTALGCLPSHPRSFIDIFIGILFGAGAGIALLLMIIGAGFVLTSQGQPERVQRGKEVFTSALVGLLFMIGAVFLLTIIGVDILGIFKSTY